MISIEKKIDTDYIVTCDVCNNSDDDKLMLVGSFRSMVQCMECGHLNDRSWNNPMSDDDFYDMLLDAVM